MFWRKRKNNDGKGNVTESEHTTHTAEELDLWSNEPYDNVDTWKWARLADFPTLMSRLSVRLDCGPVDSIFNFRFSVPKSIMFNGQEILADKIIEIVETKYTEMVQCNVPEEKQKPITFTPYIRSFPDMRSNTEKQILQVLRSAPTEPLEGVIYDATDV